MSGDGGAPKVGGYLVATRWRRGVALVVGGVLAAGSLVAAGPHASADSRFRLPTCPTTQQPEVNGWRIGSFAPQSTRTLDNGRTTEVSFRASIKSSGASADNVTATLRLPSPFTVVAPVAVFGSVRRNATEQSTGVLKIKAPTSSSLSCSDFRWTVQSTPRPVITVDAGADRTGHPGVPIALLATIANADSLFEAAATRDDGNDRDDDNERDGDNGNDDDRLRIRWTVVSKPSSSNPSLKGSKTATPTFTPDAVGRYELQVAIVGRNGQTLASDRVVITSQNQAPRADAGADQAVASGALVTLRGVGTDPENDPVSLRWEIRSQPTGATARLDRTTSSSATFTPTVSGTYVVRLTVTDPFGATGTDEVVVTVGAGVNQPPVVAAGPDRTGVRSDLFTLAGSATDPDGGSVVTRWSVLVSPAGSSVTFTDPTSASTTVRLSAPGRYELRLTATDPQGAAATDDMVVTVGNGVPTVNAGPDEVVNVGRPISLHATASDPDGDTLTYAWVIRSAPSGSSATLQNPATDTSTLQPDRAGIYVVAVTVTDRFGASATDEVSVDANAVPIVDAGPDATGPRNTPIALNGAGSDPDALDALSFQWSVAQKPSAAAATSFANATAAATTFRADTVGTYVLSLSVADGRGGTASDTVTVVVVNRAPLANAGSDLTGRSATAVQLSGTASDPDGDAITTSWIVVAQPTGSAVTLAGAATLTPSFTPAKDGTYTLQLSVTDALGAVAVDQVDVAVATPNAPPTVDAGESAQVLRNRDVTLSAIANDPDGDALTVAWSVESSPALSIKTFGDLRALQTTFRANTIGTYVLRVTVTDARGLSATDTVTIVVINGLPTASAGNDRDALTGEVVALSGAGSSDPDAELLSYSWVLTAKPAGSTTVIANPSAVAASLTPDRPGEYRVTLTVTDPIGASASAVVVITVAQANRPPTVSAGTDETTFRNVPVGLAATADDPDGDALTVAWTVTGKPAGSVATLTNADVLTPTFRADTIGVYELTVTVTDGRSAPVADTVLVTVQNRAPIANAGADRNVAKDRAAVLDGSASSDPDGDTLAFQWTLVRKPVGSAALLGAATTAAPTITPDVKGTYELSLVVSDGINTSAADSVVLQVDNSVPVVSVRADQASKPAGSTFTFTASPSDPDNDPLTPTWILANKPAGSTATLLIAPNQLSATLVADRRGSYAVDVSVSDGTASSAPARATVDALNRAPVAAVQILTAAPHPVGATIDLASVGSADADGDPLTYGWSVTLPNGTDVALSGDATASFAPTTVGAHTINLIVNDGSVNSPVASVPFVVTAAASVVADAGADQSRPFGSVFTLDGTGSTGVAGGGALTYAWRVVSAPAGSTAAPTPSTADRPTFSPDRKGTYTLELVVTQGAVSSPPDTVQLTVTNLAPIASAATPRLAAPAVGTVFNGSGSNDPDGDPLTYTWSVLVKPAGSTVPDTLANAASPTFTADQLGTYQFRLVVSDPAGAQSNAVEFSVHVNVIQLGAIPATVPGDTVSFPLRLGAPAPVGGITVSLVSANPSVASVPSSVTFPEGAVTVPNLNAVAGVLGTSVVTASTPGLTNDTKTATVSLRLEWSVPSTNVFAGSTSTLQLRASGAAPAGGLTVNLTSSNATRISVPATATIPAGQTFTNVVVSALSSAGAATVTATRPGTPAVTVATTLTVLSAVTTDLGPDEFLGRDLQRPISVGFGSSPAANPSTITFTSSDPTKLLVSTSPTLAGAAAQSVPLVLSTFGGSTTLYLQALSDTGTVTVTATSSGFATDSMVVTLRPSGFVWADQPALNHFGLLRSQDFFFNPYRVHVGYLNTPSLTFGYGPDPFQGFATEESIRAGFGNRSVVISNSNAAVGSFPASFDFVAGSNSFSEATFTAKAAGTTQLTLVTPAGFSTPSERQVRTVEVSAPSDLGLTLNEVPGRNLQVAGQVLLSTAQTAGVDVTVTSSDPTKLLVSPSVVTPGSSAVTVRIPGGATSAGIVVQSLSATGTVTLTVSAPGFTSVTQTVTLMDSTVAWVTPSPQALQVPAETLQVPLGPVQRLIRTYQARPNGSGGFVFGSEQTLRAGFVLGVTVTSSSPSVAAPSPSTFTMSTNSLTATATITPLAAGTATLTITNDGGFRSVGTRSAKSVTVTEPAPSLFVSAPTTVGRGLFTSGSVGVSPAASSATRQVTVTATDPTKLLLSLTATDAPSPSVTATLTGTSSTTLFFHALADTGTGEFTVSSAGLTSVTRTVALSPSGFIWDSPSPRALNTPGVSGSLTSFSAALPTGNQILQPVSAAVSAPVSNSNPAVGTLAASTLSFKRGDSSASVSFVPAVRGSAVLTIAPPPGFVAAPTLSAQKTVNVTFDQSITGTAAMSVGRDFTNLQTLRITDNLAGVPVQVTVGDPSIATVSSGVALDGASTVTIPNVSSSFGVAIQGRAAGTTWIRATAAGYSDFLGTITVVEPSLAWVSNSPAVGVGVADTIGLSVTGASFRDVLRPGVSITVALSSSDPSVYSVPASATITAPQTSVSFTGTPLRPGTGTLSMAAVAGWPALSRTTPKTVRAESFDLSPVGAIDGGVTGTFFSLSGGGTRTVTVSVDAPAIADLSLTPSGPTAASFVLSIGQAALPLYIHGRAVGEVQLTLSAPGVASLTSTFTVSPVGLHVSAPFPTGFSFLDRIETTAAAPSSEVEVVASMSSDALGTSLTPFDAFFPPAAFEVPVGYVVRSSNPLVAGVSFSTADGTGAATLTGAMSPGGATRRSVFVDPVAAGFTTITIEADPRFNNAAEIYRTFNVVVRP